MTFGSINLRQVPSMSNLSFRHKYNLIDIQQCLLDNLWNSRNAQEKVKVLNALAYYFNQTNSQNTQVDKKNFAFYLVINGRQPDIYNHWPHVLQQIENFPNPIYKGYHAFHEAIVEVRNYLDPNYLLAKI